MNTYIDCSGSMSTPGARKRAIEIAAERSPDGPWFWFNHGVGPLKTLDDVFKVPMGGTDLLGVITHAGGEPALVISDGMFNPVAAELAENLEFIDVRLV